MKTELKSAQTLYAKLQKKYEDKPHQTLGTVLCSMELVIKQLQELANQ